jgi:hypothetical protein
MVCPIAASPPDALRSRSWPSRLPPRPCRADRGCEPPMGVDGSSRCSVARRRRRTEIALRPASPTHESSAPLQSHLPTRALRSRGSRPPTLASSPGVVATGASRPGRVVCPSVDPRWELAFPMRPRSLARAERVHSRAPDRSGSLRRRGRYAPSSRADLAVSHGLAGFLRTRVAGVAACCRPWGSPRFLPARSARSTHPSASRPRKSVSSGSAAGSPRREPPLEGPLRSPASPSAVSRLGLPPCASGSPAPPASTDPRCQWSILPVPHGSRALRGLVSGARSVSPSAPVAGRDGARPPWACFSLRGPLPFRTAPRGALTPVGRSIRGVSAPRSSTSPAPVRP